MKVIKVIYKSSGTERIINEAAFNPEQHERIDEKPKAQEKPKPAAKKKPS